MTSADVWELKRFPVLYEGDEPKAVLVDINTFKRIELLLDNLLNQEPEPEDDVLAQFEALQRIVEQITRQKLQPTSNWRQTLDEL